MTILPAPEAELLVVALATFLGYGEEDEGGPTPYAVVHGAAVVTKELLQHFADYLARDQDIVGSAERKSTENDNAHE